jgi:YHS domain-containing protein
MMQIDPVCGKQVPERGNPQQTEYATAYYYFCSLQCLQRFEAEPDLFTLEPGEGSLANRDRGIRPVANPRVGRHAKLEQGHCH